MSAIEYVSKKGPVSGITAQAESAPTSAPQSSGPRMQSGRQVFADAGIGAASSAYVPAAQGEGLASRAVQVVLGFLNSLVSSAERTNSRMNWEIEKLKQELPKVERFIIDAKTTEALAGRTVTRLEGELAEIRTKGKQAQTAAGNATDPAVKGRFEKTVEELKVAFVAKEEEIAAAKGDHEQAKADLAKHTQAAKAIQGKINSTIGTLQKAMSGAKRGDQQAKLAATLRNAETFGTGRVAELLKTAEERAVRGEVELNHTLEGSGVLRDHELSEAVRADKAKSVTF